MSVVCVQNTLLKDWTRITDRDNGSRQLRKPRHLARVRELTLRDMPVRIRNCEFEGIFCQVDGNDRGIHIGLPLVRTFAETLHMLSLAH